MRETGRSGPVHRDDPEELDRESWIGREVGVGFRMWDKGTHMADFCQCMAKNRTIL